MKKIILMIAIILLIMLVIYNKQEPNKQEQKEIPFEEKGVFISYIDYSVLKNKNKDEINKIISEMINNISYFGLNSIILQTTPFSDAIYPSKIYQTSHTIVKEEGDKLEVDILQTFIDKAKEKNIYVYAWINPFRIRSDNNKGDINKNTYYYKWFNTDNIQITDKGIYLNPAKKEVIEYITNGLEELCQNYDIKGVLFDDYYYPNNTIDLKTYEKTDKRKNLKEYRIDNINNLIEQSYKTVKKVNKDIKFGLSPSGNIENNLDKEYLDITYILKQDYIDFVIPQLYYGFNNSAKPYIKVLNDWSNININNKSLYVALALYKSGNIDTYAGKGENEWLENTDILKKQILIARNIKNYKGFYIFRYENLFDIHNNNNLEKEVQNIKNLLDKS